MLSKIKQVDAVNLALENKSVNQSLVVSVQSQPANLLIFSIGHCTKNSRFFPLLHAVAPAIMGLGADVESENPAAAAGPNPDPRLEAIEAMDGWYCPYWP